MTHYVRPSLSVIDAYEGMERRGPTGGDPVPLHIAAASTDFVAADRVCVDLMEMEFDKIGYLTYCAGAGMGHGDPARIDVLGERIAACKRSFVRPDNYAEQTVW
jgi:uncharacterized protein (DUF362 family)